MLQNCKLYTAGAGRVPWNAPQPAGVTAHMRPLFLLLAACAALAAAPATSTAKGIVGVDVCGADGCSAVDEASFHAALAVGRPVSAAVPAAPFVTVRVKFADGPRATPRSESFTYVPSLGLVRQDSTASWTKLFPARRSELDKVVAAIRLLPAAELSGAVQPAADAAPDDDGTPWPPIVGAAAAALALLALLARYATSALKARPRASKSAN